jgi:hypothetical protein
VAGAGDILSVATAVDVNALGRQFQHPIGQYRQEVPVVRKERRPCNRRVWRGALGDLRLSKRLILWLTGVTRWNIR